MEQRPVQEQKRKTNTPSSSPPRQQSIAHGDAKDSDGDSFMSETSSSSSSSSSSSLSGEKQSGLTGVPSLTAAAIKNAERTSQAAGLLFKLQSEFSAYLKKYPTQPLEQNRFTQNMALLLWLKQASKRTNSVVVTESSISEGKAASSSAFGGANGLSWNDAAQGVYNTFDMLFIAMCLERVCRRADAFHAVHEKMIEGWNTQSKLEQIKSLALNWRTNKVATDSPLIDKLLDWCSWFIVFFFIKRGFDAVLSITFDRYNFVFNPFKEIVPNAENSAELKKSFETAADGTTGESDEEKAAYKQKEMEILSRAAAQKTASEFIPWCTRVFFEILFVRDIVLKDRVVPLWTSTADDGDAKMSVDPDSSAQEHQGPEEWKAAMSNDFKWRTHAEGWFEHRCQIEQTSQCLDMFREFAYRLVLIPGAVGYWRRQPQDESLLIKNAEYFNRDCDNATLCELYHKMLDMNTKNVYAIKEHAFRDTLAFVLFCDLVCNMSRNDAGFIDIMKHYLLVEDELPQKFGDLVITTRGLRPVRPRFANIHGCWYILFNLKLYECKDALHAIVMWLLLMKNRFENQIEDRRSIPKEFEEMFFQGKF